MPHYLHLEPDARNNNLAIFQILRLLPVSNDLSSGIQIFANDVQSEESYVINIFKVSGDNMLVLINELRNGELLEQLVQPVVMVGAFLLHQVVVHSIYKCNFTTEGFPRNRTKVYPTRIPLQNVMSRHTAVPNSRRRRN